MSVPAISGAETKTFDTMFWKGITEKKLVDRKTVPFKGSIGVFWQVYKDIKELGVNAIKDEKVNKLYPRNAEEGKVITAVNAKALKAFYEWAESAQPFFFIKKGTQPLWLCQKVGGYYYEDRDDPYWYPHRIAFEFVRQASEKEGVKRMGIGMNTMIWIEMDPLPKPAVPTSVEMPPKKTKAKTKPETKPKGRKAKPKAIETTVAEPIPLVTNSTLQTTYAETAEEPLEVEVVKVQAFELDGTQYFREPVKNKLYKRLANGVPGPYIGRYSPKDQRVHEEVEDSDREDDF
jgi:hypothetical protein